MRVQLHLRADKLSNIAKGKWRGKRSSPYIKIQHLSNITNNNNNENNDNTTNTTLLLGSTEVQHATLSPNFATSFILNHDEDQGWTHLRITIRDCRKSVKGNGEGGLSQRSRAAGSHRRIPLQNYIIGHSNFNEQHHDDSHNEEYCNDDLDPIMGEVDIEIGDVLRCQGQEKELTLSRNGGTLYVLATESIQGDTVGIMNCQIRGLDVKNIESGLLGLGAVDPYFVIRKKYNDIKSGLIKWCIVYRSEYIHDIINPFWKPFTLDLERLCNNDLNKQLKITIYDQQEYGTDRWLGEVMTSVKELMESVAMRGNADREAALNAVAVEKDGKEDVRALLVILKATVISE